MMASLSAFDAPGTEKNSIDTDTFLNALPNTLPNPALAAAVRQAPTGDSHRAAPAPNPQTSPMSSSRRVFRLVVLAVIGISLTACHFHRGGCRGFRYKAPVRICR